ncbi:MAG: thioredoxin domain-containing protein [Anaerolineales bacterium]
MSKKDREGPSKRQEFREKRRRAELRNRWIVIGAIIVIAVLIVGAFAYYQLQPVAAIQKADARTRPNVNRNLSGDPNAPVKLVEFADFQCPYCKEFWSTTEAQVFSTYVTTGKVLYTYRSAGNWVSGNIGDGGFESQNSAMAAYCAADQNKFWQMHDALFANVLGEDAGSFTGRRLQAIAQNIGLDMSAFNSCYSSQKYLSQVNQDFADAQASGIQGTPWFVLSYTVNGQTKTSTIDGNQPFNVFQQDIDQALAAAGAK